MAFSILTAPTNYFSINPPVIRLPDFNFVPGDLSEQLQKKSKDSAFTLARFLLDVNIRTDLKQQLEPLIQDAFNKLSSFLGEVVAAAENLLGRSRQLLEDLVNQVSEKLSELLTEVEQIVGNLLSQVSSLAERIIDRFRTDILDRFFDRVDSLRRDLINDLRQLIQEVTQRGNELLYKGDVIVTGTLASIKDNIDKLAADLEETLDIRKWFDPDERVARREEDEREDFCKDKIGAVGVAFSTLGSAQFYEYRQCVTQRRLNDAIERSEGRVTVRNMKLVYADLQERAWKLATIGRTEGSSLQNIALTDWIKFGQLFQLWNQFEDDMEVLEAINQRVNELDQKIDAAQARAQQLDDRFSTLIVKRFSQSIVFGTGANAPSTQGFEDYTFSPPDATRVIAGWWSLQSDASSSSSSAFKQFSIGGTSGRDNDMPTMSETSVTFRVSKGDDDPGLIRVLFTVIYV